MPRILTINGGFSNVNPATMLPLAVLGFVTGRLIGVPKLKGPLQTALVGSPAEGVAYLSLLLDGRSRLLP